MGKSRTVRWPVILAIMGGICGPVARAQDPLRGWKTDARTTAIDLVAVNALGGITTFAFKNVSGKPIRGLVVSYDGIEHGTDYFDTGGALQPDQQYMVRVGDSELVGGTLILQLAAVVFADGTAQGVQETIDFMKDRHLGRTLEAERIRDTLTRYTKNNLDDSRLESLISAVGDLPKSVEQALDAVGGISRSGLPADYVASDGFLAGVRGVREEAQRKLDGIRGLPLTASGQSGGTRAGGLLQLAQIYTGLSAKHRTILEVERTGGKQ